ncbi:MAG: ATPase, T2SS/T4P/T4SS family, partial [Planctomycetota bacterium]
TLHTNDAPSTVARLRYMEVEPYLISSALNGVVAQRLARTLCGSCETTYYADDALLETEGLTHLRGRALRRGEGCQRCHDSGFAGRLGVYEVLEVTGSLRRMIYRDAPTHKIRQAFVDGGGKTLRDEGIEHALAGKTSLEEVLRVTRSDDSASPPVAPKTETDPAETLREDAA